jgi:nucleoside-diphosphate-sugar epimerase
MIGFKILMALLEAGYSVRAATRNQAGFDRVSSLKPVARFKAQLSGVIVPDITVPGAYDEAVQGVKYIIHVASPLAGKTTATDYEASMIHPAIRGTVGILESAAKVAGIARVVITASVASLASTARLQSGQVVNGNLTLLPSSAPNTDRC